MAEAGADSPHLNERERDQAAERAEVGPLVIHEIVREAGHAELERSFSGLAWSGLAAGLSIGFSPVLQAYLQSSLPDTAWRPLIASFGYTLGFVIVILGRQQLFTETTLTALIPTLTRRDIPTLLQTMRVWVIVLLSNLVGTWIFAAAAARPEVFPPQVDAAIQQLAAHLMGHEFWPTVVHAAAAGWLIGLMVWLLPASGSARPWIIILLTYTVALFQLPHIIAGSVEAAFAVCTGQAGIGDYAWKFLLPTFLGNAFGGTALAALLNHAPVASELQE